MAGKLIKGFHAYIRSCAQLGWLNMKIGSNIELQESKE